MSYTPDYFNSSHRQPNDIYMYSSPNKDNWTTYHENNLFMA